MKKRFLKKFSVIYNVVFTSEFNAIEYAFCNIKNKFIHYQMSNKEETT